ncbi:unnamed protein product [Tetraodon nigroviridis]|uniref:(spotted green pufferfish) hypothetical protein n=1 Tax=Tetraodon nigroviridis TaxID=99883 RepID=Q4SRK7_TETNG|nr:unnamed protein product [Tetraodon nigroviridis]
MAPLWKTMLSKSSPLYRDALFSFSLWEWKAQEREVLLLKKAGERERRALLTHVHNKELQQKDKLIESLQARLNQHHHPHRSDTPSSGHALSEASDQSDGISYVSEDRGSTAEDLDPGSDISAPTRRPLPPPAHPTSPGSAVLACRSSARRISPLTSGATQVRARARWTRARVHAGPERACTLDQSARVALSHLLDSLVLLLRSAPPSAFLTSFQDPPPPLPPPFFSCVQRDPFPPHPRCRGNALQASHWLRRIRSCRCYRGSWESVSVRPPLSV